MIIAIQNDIIIQHAEILGDALVPSRKGNAPVLRGDIFTVIVIYSTLTNQSHIGDEDAG